MKFAPPTRLSVEQLEARLTPTWGVPWYSPTTLTLSFAPDGTDVSGSPSALQALLGSDAPAWQREILRAFQTWAVEANINIGLVSDQGQAFGSSSLPQGDPRFGDIRLGARPLGLVAGEVDLAHGVGYDDAGGSWSGDVLLNTLFNFAIGDAPGQHDLFSVALHEAGHSFGLADDPSNPNSVLHPSYQVWEGLSPADVAALQALYGVRAPDAFEGAAGNNTPETAFDLTSNGNLTAIAGDITHAGDADYYRFTTPAAGSGATGLTVKLRASGVSLLTARVTIFDEAGNVVASAVTVDPLSNDLSVALANYDPSTTYSVKVEGAGTDVFSVGTYQLRLAYTDAAGDPVVVGNSFGLGSPYVNTGSGTNTTIETAQGLGFSSATHSTAFAASGALSNPTDAHWYQITPTALTSFTGTLTVGVVPQGQGTSGARARVAVFDAQGNELQTVVVTNEYGAFTVQLADQAPGQTYFVRVTAADPNGARAVGGYALAAHLTATEVTTFDTVTDTTVTGAADALYSQMALDQGRLVQFSLSAETGPSAPTQAIQMTIVDATGHAVFRLAVAAGTPLATGTVWLGAGDYTVVFNAATADGSPLHDLDVAVSARERSDPMDPLYRDPNFTLPLPLLPPLSPPPPPPMPPNSWFTTTTVSTVPPPGLVLLDPIPNPFFSLY